MGKSPGKWIKTVLFGKKSTKSSFSKNAAIEKKSSFGAKASSGVLAVDPPVNADLPPETTCITNENLESGISDNLSCDAVLLPGRQGEDTEGAVRLNSTNNAEKIQQEQAATKAQSAFRGYLARRAFRALKGIIRLQALIRGHLVRRQAVATLRCMQTIVKFQALVRGRRVRLSYAGFEVLKKGRQVESMECRRVDLTAVNPFLRSEKLSRNAFVIKLVASSPLIMPLRLQYDVAEPNSVWNWLERWSSSRFWEPLARPKKILNSKRQKKQIAERESGRPKRGAQRVPGLNNDSNSPHTSEYEKPKRNQRKAPSPQTESVLEQSQNELEKVKRNLRKVSVSAEEASDKTETGTDKMHCSLKKELSSHAPDVSERAIDNSSEKTSEQTIAVSEQPLVEPPPKQLAVDELVETLHEDHPAVELLSSQSSEKIMNNDNVNVDSSSKEDQTKENEKTRRRRSFTGKQEYPENVSQNTSTLPSYMAVTESAKAKLRAQGSPTNGQDGAENGPIRRHSLPSSTNGKLSSLSPRVQRTVQANGKGGNRSDRSLLSPKDEKLLQPGWRR